MQEGTVKTIDWKKEIDSKESEGALSADKIIVNFIGMWMEQLLFFGSMAATNHTSNNKIKKKLPPVVQPSIIAIGNCWYASTCIIFDRFGFLGLFLFVSYSKELVTLWLVSIIWHNWKNINL